LKIKQVIEVFNGVYNEKALASARAFSTKTRNQIGNKAGYRILFF
jgi:hypothetical protein